MTNYKNRLDALESMMDIVLQEGYAREDYVLFTFINSIVMALD